MNPSQHEVWMRRAIALAARGIGTTHPNPRVGAVVVKDGVMVGEGWHERAGEPHAEVHALNDAGAAANGATLYVSLEPCNSAGRTPACSEAVIEAGITTLYYASADPNPAMAGGAARLRAAGVKVFGGLLADAADALNRPFFHYLRTGRPYLIAKAAISLDGKLATRTHHSQWISSAASRAHAHGVRARCDAILVGAGTLRHDNPSLTVRDAEPVGDLPLRVVICRRAPEFFTDCKLLSDEALSRFYLQQSHLSEHDHATIAQWRQAGIDVVVLDAEDYLPAVLRHLAADGRLELLLEGGGRLHGACLAAGLSDELLLYQAPMLIGGDAAVSLWQGEGVAQVTEAVQLVEIERTLLDKDQLIRGRLRYPAL